MAAVNEDAERERRKWLEDAERERRRWLRPDPEQEEEWRQQNNLTYVGLIGLGLVMVQPFLTAESLDLPAKICVVSFSVAIPLLAALVGVNRQETLRHRTTSSVTVSIAKMVAQTTAFAGMVAGLWHILWIAGAATMASGIIGMMVHSAGFVRLERDAELPSPGEEEPGDSES